MRSQCNNAEIGSEFVVTPAAKTAQYLIRDAGSIERLE
jgi:hypothetical protein